MRPPALLGPCLGLLAIASAFTPDLRAARAPWSDYARQPDAWYWSAAGQQVTSHVLSWQSPAGSWPKNQDNSAALRPADRESLRGTFDNGATTPELRFLARAFQATADPTCQAAFLKGLDHILEAQYPIGGWPQSYPPGAGYARHLTFNDHAMVRLMEFVRDVASLPEYEFVDAAHRRAAAASFDAGVRCILRCQILVDGKPTVWCAQHDEVTGQPRPGRAYELVSLSGAESAGILRLLMSLENPSPDVIRTIEAGVAWFEAAQLRGIRIEQVNGDRHVVPDAAAPPLWARFYEIGSNRPIFCGRDGIKRYRLSEIEAERRNGYSWYGPYGALVLAAYPEWQQGLRKTTKPPTP